MQSSANLLRTIQNISNPAVAAFQKLVDSSLRFLKAISPSLKPAPLLLAPSFSPLRESAYLTPRLDQIRPVAQKVNRLLDQQTQLNQKLNQIEQATKTLWLKITSIWVI